MVQVGIRAVARPVVPATALVVATAAADAMFAGGIAATPSRRGQGPALPPVRPVATPPAIATPIPPLLREDEPSFPDVPHGGLDCLFYHKFF